MITAILFFLAGLFNANMDVLKFRQGANVWPMNDEWNEQSKFIKWLIYWSEPASWRNKYKRRDPKAGPKFIGSTTIFVWITDMWHFSQMLWRTAAVAGAVLYEPIVHIQYGFLIDFVIISTAYLLAFNIGFEKILCKK